MRVDIHPSRGHQQAAGVDLTPRRARLPADPDNPAAVDRDIAAECRRARAVDDHPVADYLVVHTPRPPLGVVQSLNQGARRFSKQRGCELHRDCGAQLKFYGDLTMVQIARMRLRSLALDRFRALDI